MRKITFVIVLLALVSALGITRADSPTEVRSAIQTRYNQFDRAYMQKDFMTVGKVFTADCLLHLKSENRSMTAPRVVQGMLLMSKALTVSHAKTRIVSVKAQGDTYEVSAVWTADSAYTPTNATIDDRPRRGKTQQTFHDTWKKTKNDWQIARRIIEG